MKNKYDNICSISEYAALCGVSHTIIRKRIKNGEIQLYKPNLYPFSLIDSKKYPPIGKKNPGRKTFKQTLAK